MLLLCTKLCFMLFFTCIYGIVFNNRNLIIILIFIELGFVSLSLLLLVYAWYYSSIQNYVLIIYVLTLTAVEAAVGLALFIMYYKVFKSIELDDFYEFRN